MAKLIELQEAAAILGITPEELTEMRSRNEIFGYRDGSTWKFKADEIDRVKAAKGLGGAPGFGGDLDDDLLDASELNLDDDISINLDADEDVLEFSTGEDSDSILVSEEELGKSDENTASTIIGEADDLILDGSDSDVTEGVSDIELSMDKSDVFSASDVLNTLEDKKSPTASDTANISLNALASSSDSLKLQSDSGSLSLSLDDLGSTTGSRIELSDDAKASSSGFGSAIDLGLDDDELVLGSGTGSDITSAGDSGISLGNPSDSGLSLEEPLELSAGSGIDSLELGEDNMLELDDAMLLDGEPSDDDFMLTPVEDAADEESDSGSQVIALDSEEFDDSAVDMLSDDAPAFEAEGGFEADEDDLGAPAGFATTAATSSMAVAGMAEEADGTYSIWNVLGLFMIVGLLSFSGVLLVDLINNIWSWDGTYSFNSTIMDAILGMMPGA